MNVFVARQPILDQRGHLFAYELLFRESMDNFFKFQDGDLATSSVTSSSFFLMDINQITMGKPAFINFTSNLLKQGMATLLPRDSVVIEILENVDPDLEIIAACKELKELGYKLALDDFVFRKEYRPLIELADIIKVDFQCTDIVERLALIQSLNKPKVRFLAEKVETFEEFEEAKSIGYSLFQGYYFSRPCVVQGKDIPASKINYLKLLQEISRPDIEIEALEHIIKRDISLTYKLLKFINSSAFGFKSKISSIRQVLTLLGQREFKKWVSVVVLGSISEGKPDALAVQSYVRATFAELLAPKAGLGAQASSIFLMGLFSLIDACLDRPLPDILKELPIEDSIKNALLGYPNIYRDLLELITDYEQGNWKQVSRHALKLRIDEECIPPYYVKALEGANSFMTN